MPRAIGPSDLIAAWRVRKPVRAHNPDVLHGHGAKGGAYARIIGTSLRATGSSVARIYTPHGGSLHFHRRTISGRVYFAAERILSRLTDAFAFVSSYEAGIFAAKVGEAGRPVAVVHNGLHPEEFEPVESDTDAVDFMFIGMLRDLKGPDVFIDALDCLRRRGGRDATAVIVGAGDDKTRYQAMVHEKGLNQAVSFRDPMPARDAFALCRTVVVPSRAESMPYIVLESIAAGVPVIATNVGGIPEIFGDMSDRLIAPGDPDALAEAMSAHLERSVDVHRNAGLLRDRLRTVFTVEAMASEVADVYRMATTR